MRIPVSAIVESQLPSFVREEYPLFSEFLQQYYLSDTSEELIQNLDKNLNLDVIFNIKTETKLTSDIFFNDQILSVDSTEGFPDNYGLLKVNNEIILYTSKNETEFIGCVRGFSGIEKIDKKFLNFTETLADNHSANSNVINLSILYLQQFALQTKKKIAPGFEDRKLFSGLNLANFIKNSKTFYSSKGSDESFRILFGALYGKPVDVIKPRDFLIRPSDAQYRVTKDLIVEVIQGDPYELVNTTVYQDETDTINPAQGTVIDVTTIIRNNKEYFIISLDFDYNRDVDVSGTIKSEFSIHPKTLSTSKIRRNSNYIDVDSTIGFPQTGILKVDLPSGQVLNISYKNKVLNQFLDCSGINNDIPEKTEIKIDNFIYGLDKNKNKVKIFVNGVLGDIDYIDDTFYYEAGEQIRIKTLGDNASGIKANNWFFNISVEYEVSTLELRDESDFSYRLELFDQHNFVIGDSFTLNSSNGLQYLGTILFVENENIVIISGQGELPNSSSFSIRKNISKVNVVNPEYNYLKVFNSNVQNTYTDYDKNVYVSSPSLPTYLGFPININDFTLKVPSGIYSGSTELNLNVRHGLFSGELVVLKSKNNNKIADDGVYVVSVFDQTIIRLANSHEDVVSGNFVVFDGSITTGNESLIEPARFNDLGLKKLPLSPQNIIKKLESPKIKEENKDTVPGSIGILVNGVEISNYKSEDTSFYGPIQKVEVLDGGKEYNLIDPPSLNVVDQFGTGALIIPGLEGGLHRIDIIDPGFDYIEVPQIKITGGGGSGAEAVAKLISFTHFSEFNSENSVNLSTNVIEFNEDHRFSDNEEVIYQTNNQKNIVGIDTNSKYFVKPIDSKRVQLYYTLEDSLNNVNAINLSEIGRGIHALSSVNPKKKISEIVVLNPGSNYRNKRVKISGINTSANTLIIKDHGYFSGEVVDYFNEQTPISGLDINKSYFVDVVDLNQVRLAEFSSEQSSDYNFKKKDFVKISSLPTGDHYLNYPEIKVEVSGRIGISTFSGQDFSAKIQPVFYGKIYSVFIENAGLNYGVPNILNYEKKPEIVINSGKNAQVTPIINNGSISRIIINSPGSDYNQIPELLISPSSNNINLTPVIENGKLVDVIVISGGQNLNPNNTFITVIPKGVDAKFNVNVYSRRVNNVQKLISSNNITNDDGYIVKNVKTLQYTHLYAPRSLRRSLLRKVGNINVRDLNIVQNKEISSIAHSPLIGWAYDGNPIYGPYGYSDGNSGAVKAMVSGYKLKSNSQLITENRPPITIFPRGFFVEDYIFDGSGDLDENNGRFCVTPEFPSGVYAYFCTISNVVSNSGPFINYFPPTFPYIIGPSFKNKEIISSETFDSLGKKILRNTTPYNLLNERSRYDFILNPNRIKEESIDIIQTKRSVVDGIDVINGGDNYKINDSIILSDGTLAKVSELSGKEILNIGISNTSYSNLEVVPFRNSFIGILEEPHQITTLNEFRFNSKFEINKKIKVTPVRTDLKLSSPVDIEPITGKITFFNVSGNLDFPLKENDIFMIEDEKIRVLSIDKKSARIKVEREVDGTTSNITPYPVNTPLQEISRKVLFNIGLSTNYNFKINDEYYFNPNESIGIGTIGNSTLNFSNPGVGVTVLTIPNNTVFIENHSIQTGDEIIYSPNGGDSIQISYSGIGTTSLLEIPQLFASKVSNNLIGISTTRTTDKLLSFSSIGVGVNHSFKTNYQNNLTGSITNNIVNVITKSTHNLNPLDEINLSVISGVTTTYKVFYDDFNRRICINKKNIVSINVSENTIEIPDHKFKLSEKIIFRQTSPVSGLVDKQIYFVVPITKDKIKLTKTYYESITEPLNEINLTSSGTGYFYSINPKIEIINDQNIVFDVSDPSLGFNISGDLYSAFELKLYEDKNLINEHLTFDLEKNGIVGVSSDASYTLVTKDIPDNLYYTFRPTNISLSPNIKKEIFIDFDQIDAYKLNKIQSKYSGNFNLVSTSSTIFSYELFEFPENYGYNSDTSQLIYTTKSGNATGPISDIKITNQEYSTKIPSVVEIKTQDGIGAILKPRSKDIGKIENTKKLDIGFDYSIDYTMRPKANIPKVIRVKNLSSLDTISVSERGFGYSFSPDLLLIDSITRNVYDDCDLSYDLIDNSVKIIRNTNRILNNNLTIIPINNDNGFDIDEILFDNVSKIVTVILKTPFNDIEDFPFIVGERVYIETVPNIGGTGYNSSNYGYNTFEILTTTPNIGGTGATFTYRLNALDVGVVDTTYTSGFAIPEKFLPKFNLTTKNNSYLKNEKINTISGKIGEVSNWDPENSIIKILSNDNINVDDVIIGLSSKTYSVVLDVYSPEAYININSNSVVNKGWNRRTGFLNDPLQRLHDSNYYQYFSYELRSEEPFNEWSDVVDALNHTAGFKKFGNLLINTTHNNIGFNTSQNLGDVEVVNDLQNVVNVNCFSDFDLVTENYFNIDENLNSNEIYFNSRRIQNYIESIGNKVVTIDDISDKFLPVVRENNTNADEFNKFLFRFKKYVIHIFDRIEPTESQTQLLNLLHNDTIVAINQYAINDSGKELGNFDAKINGLNLDIRFFPFDISNKLYSINSFSFNISDSDLDLGTLPLGNSVVINSYRATGIGTTTIPNTILTIPNTKKAGKVLLVYSDKANLKYYSDEINFIQNGTDILFNSYGELNLGNPVGIGTYEFYYTDEDNDIGLLFYPNDTGNYEINSLVVEFGDNTQTTTDGIVVSGNLLESSVIQLSSDTRTRLYSYNDDYKAGLHQILIEDTTTGNINYCEFLTMLNSSNIETYSVEFGNIDLNNKMGNLEIDYSSGSGELEIYFDPFTSSNYSIKVFSNLISRFRRSETLEL